jgi:hypothetical protein
MHSTSWRSIADFAAETPALRRFLGGGVVAGGASALVNSVYFLVYRAATGIQLTEPTLGSIALSSLFPSLLGALGYGVLARWTRKATAVFTALTCAITLASFESVFRDTLPDGTLKPVGFDALVMPMHLVVGTLAVVIVPRIARARTKPAGPA